MIKVEDSHVWGFKHAIRGMRNPMNSWDKSDSFLCKGNDFDDCRSTSKFCPRSDGDFAEDVFCVGNADLTLMKKLYKAGTEHRKYLRQIFVSMDITAPLYWYKEMDTYKVGTVSNSCSTMHKIADKEFELDDFSHEHLNAAVLEYTFQGVISCLNFFRDLYLQNKDKDDWWQMIQLLPSSYNQRRTITMTYENVVSIIKQRENHKLDEWREFVEILKKLPYIKEITE